jgi:hypothetical protein
VDNSDIEICAVGMYRGKVPLRRWCHHRILTGDKSKDADFRGSATARGGVRISFSRFRDIELHYSIPTFSYLIVILFYRGVTQFVLSSRCTLTVTNCDLMWPSLIVCSTDLSRTFTRIPVPAKISSAECHSARHIFIASLSPCRILLHAATSFSCRCSCCLRKLVAASPNNVPVMRPPLERYGWK